MICRAYGYNVQVLSYERTFMKHVIILTFVAALSLASCSTTNQQDLIETQVATALIATSAAQSAIDTAVAATIVSNESPQNASATPEAVAPILATATPVANGSSNTTTQSNPTATAQVIIPVDTATTEAQPEPPTETVAVPPTDTTVILPTDTAITLPTDTAIALPTETAVNGAITPINTSVIKPTSTLSLIIPTMKPLTPIVFTPLPTIRLP